MASSTAEHLPRRTDGSKGSRLRKLNSKGMLRLPAKRHRFWWIRWSSKGWWVQGEVKADIFRLGVAAIVEDHCWASSCMKTDHCMPTPMSKSMMWMHLAPSSASKRGWMQVKMANWTMGETSEKVL